MHVLIALVGTPSEQMSHAASEGRRGQLAPACGPTRLLHASAETTKMSARETIYQVRSVGKKAFAILPSVCVAEPIP